METVSLRLLIVDDEPEIPRALTRTLRGQYTMQVAGSGAEGLEKFAAFKPDLILSDFRMPQMTGIELLSEVARRSTETVRVLMSGNADQNAVRGWLAEGQIHAFLAKPWTREELTQLIAKLMSERAGR